MNMKNATIVSSKAEKEKDIEIDPLSNIGNRLSLYASKK